MIALIDYYQLEKLFRNSVLTIPYANLAKGNDVQQAANIIFNEMDPDEFSNNPVLVHTEDDIVLFNRINILDVDWIMPVLSECFLNLKKDYPMMRIIEPYKSISNEFSRINGLRVAKQNCKSGISLFRKFFGYDDSSLDYDFQNQIAEGICMRVDGKHHFDVPADKRDPWTMLVAYNRYENYCSDNKGYFLDLFEILFYMRDKQQGYKDEVLTNAKCYRAVMECNSSIKKIIDLSNHFQNDERTNKLVKMAIDYFGEEPIVPILFLLLKNKMSEILKDSSNDLNYILLLKDNYPQYSEKVVTLLGGFFGYEKLKSLFLNRTINDKTIKESDTVSLSTASEPKIEPVKEEQHCTLTIETIISAFSSKGVFSKDVPQKLAIVEKYFSNTDAITVLEKSLRNADDKTFIDDLRQMLSKVLKPSVSQSKKVYSYLIGEIKK